MILTLLTLIVTIVIVVTEIQLLGTQKTSTISLVSNTKYEFEAREHLTMWIGHWFYVDETVAHIRKF